MELRTTLTYATRTLLAALLAVLPGAAAREPQAPAGEFSALRLELRVDGIPDRDPQRPLRSAYQTLTVEAEGQRLVLDDHGEPAAAVEGDAPAGGEVKERLILRLDRDPPLVWKLLLPGGEYREFSGDLNTHQRARRVRELSQLRLLKNLPRAEQKEILEENFWREDGKRRVETRWGEPVVTLLGRPCRRLTVTENGRVIVDAFMAQDVAGGRSFFELYRRLGAFSDEVLEALQGLPGLPLKASITVVTELPVYTLEVEVRRLEEVQVAAGFFDLPPGARKIEEEPAETRCALEGCGQAVKPRAAGGMVRYKGSLLYFCSEEHARKFKDARRPVSSRPRG